MSNTSKLALVAIVAAGLSSPALAGGYPGVFANRLPYTADSAPYPIERTAPVASNAHAAFAFAPAGGLTPSDVIAGGAAPGYNRAEAEAVVNR